MWCFFNFFIFLNREQLNTLIQEQEKLGRSLREEQKAVKDLSQTSARQLTMWQDIIKLVSFLNLNLSCIENVLANISRSIFWGTLKRSDGVLVFQLKLNNCS